MPKWLRKSFVVMVSILTFGMVTPSQALWVEETIQDSSRNQDLSQLELTQTNENVEVHSVIAAKEQFIGELTGMAEVLAYQKFGSKIKPVIADEFKEVILPEIEKVIAQVAQTLPEGKLKNLSISEFPTGGFSERIFHIRDQQTGEDVIRFHVRRDNPPQQGYWFNFHYHTYNDQFLEHHTLGQIYWNKNTPPKWMC